MNTLATSIVAQTLIAQTFVADRASRYERAATNRRLVRRSMRDHHHAGRDPDGAIHHGAPHAAPSTHLVALPAANGTTRPTGTASSPTASLPVDRVA